MDVIPSQIRILIRGGGDLASGVAWRLHQCGFKIAVTEIPRPMAVRRKVAFSEAVYDGYAVVQGVEARLVRKPEAVFEVWKEEKVPVLVDAGCETKVFIQPAVLVDAIIAKKNLGTSMDDAPLVIGLGPGFEAGVDVHFVVETTRGHDLGRLLTQGAAEPNTGVPGPVRGITTGRVLRAPVDGVWLNERDIGGRVDEGDRVGTVSGEPVHAAIGGILRGVIRGGIVVEKGLKIGDIDPRGRKDYCFTISEKALAISGGVLEGILRRYAD